MESFNAFYSTTFWSFADSINNPKDAKHTYGLLVSGSKIGGILSSLLFYYMISCSRNISMDGMFINTSEPPPVGTHVNIIFPADEHHDVEVSAIVVWNREESDFQKPGMGVQFLSPLPKAVKQNFLGSVDRIVILSEKGVNA